MYFIWPPQQQLRLDPKFLGTVPEKGFATSIAPLMSESTANIQGVGEYTDCCAKLSAPVSGYKTEEFPTEEVRAVVTRYVDAMREIATSLLDILVIVFEIPEENLTQMRRLGVDATSLQRFLYFPDVPDDRVAEEMQMRIWINLRDPFCFLGVWVSFYLGNKDLFFFLRECGLRYGSPSRYRSPHAGLSHPGLQRLRVT